MFRTSFCQAEFYRWKQVCESESVKLPSREFMQTKLAGIHALINRPWTSQEIDAKIKRYNQFKLDDVESSSQSVAATTAAAAAATSGGQLLSSASSQLSSSSSQSGLGPGLGPGQGPGPGPGPVELQISKDMSPAERIAALNAINRKNNVEETRRALIRERRRELAAREQAALARKQQAAAAAAAASEKSLDVLFDEGGEDGGDDAGGAQSRQKLSSLPSSSSSPSLLDKKGIKPRQGGGAQTGIPSVRGMKMDDDVIGEMDLGIDLEI